MAELFARLLATLVVAMVAGFGFRIGWLLVDLIAEKTVSKF